MRIHLFVSFPFFIYKLTFYHNINFNLKIVFLIDPIKFYSSNISDEICLSDTSRKFVSITPRHTIDAILGLKNCEKLLDGKLKLMSLKKHTNNLMNNETLILLDECSLALISTAFRLPSVILLLRSINHIEYTIHEIEYHV